MSETNEHRYFQLIDTATRTALVRAALHDETAVVSVWHVQEIYGGASGTHIFKVTGQAQIHTGLRPWSLVLKFFNVEDGGIHGASEEPTAWNYWKREWLAYQAPWLGDMQDGLVAPRCLGAAEHPGIVDWIALEDLSQEDVRPWRLAHFQIVARHIGLFNGAYLAGKPLPTDPWLCQDWLRGWTEQAAPMVALLASVADHAMVRQIFSRSMIQELLHLWDVRDALFVALDALPQTLCHQDVFPRNAFVRQSEHGAQTVAIDWAFVGPAAVGVELATLVGGSMTFFEAAPAIAQDLETCCLRSYLEGLQVAGWQGDPDDVRFGYLASLVLRFGVGALAPILKTSLDETQYSEVEQIFGCPMDVFIQNLRATMEFLVQRSTLVRRVLALRQTSSSA